MEGKDDRLVICKLCDEEVYIEYYYPDGYVLLSCQHIVKLEDEGDE